MAVKKTLLIKSPLKKIFDDITNLAKIDDTLHIFSFGCAMETADIEFGKPWLWAMSKENILTDPIPDFEPGKITP